MKDSAIQRRFIGMLFGAVLGLSYGISSQSINRIMLPGIMLHQPPLGLAGNVMVWLLVGAVLGLVISWPKDTLVGIILGGVVGASFLTIIMLATGRTDAGIWTGKLLSVIFLFVPIAGLLVPVTGIFRWTVNKIIEARAESESTWIMLRWPLLLVVLVISVGTFSLLPPHARVMLLRTDVMLRKGLQDSSADQLPEPLQGDRVGGFIEHASSQYRLEWENTGINQFAIPRPLSDRPWEESAVIAHFDSGWKLVCVYADSEAQPGCRGFERQ